MKRILLVTPSLELHGGVCEYNKMLIKYSKHKLIPFELHSTLYNNSILKLLFFVSDIIRFIIFCLIKKVDIVHLGPSLGKNALIRDSIFTYISKTYNKSVFIQWHGWNPNNEYLISSKHNSFFINTLYRADHIRFLSLTFKDKICASGYSNNWSIGNTFIDDDFLNISEQKSDCDSIKILFLSTLSKNKGIYTALKAFSLLNHKNISLTVAGKGSEIESVNQFINTHKNLSISYIGYVDGYKKVSTYLNSDIYIFPSLYEGMPTSVIEAMGLGLPVVCSNVGALPDFFVNEKMGFMIDDNSPLKFAEKLSILIENEQRRKDISQFNQNFVKTCFIASASVSKIDELYHSI